MEGQLKNKCVKEWTVQAGHWGRQAWWWGCTLEAVAGWGLEASVLCSLLASFLSHPPSSLQPHDPLKLEKELGPNRRPGYPTCRFLTLWWECGVLTVSDFCDLMDYSPPDSSPMEFSARILRCCHVSGLFPPVGIKPASFGRWIPYSLSHLGAVFLEKFLNDDNFQKVYMFELYTLE